MTLEEILSLDLLGKSIFIVGPPASGKTFLSLQLSSGGRQVIHTDELIKYHPHPVIASVVLEMVVGMEEQGIHNTVVEGMHAYGVLLKGAEYSSYRPDVVIECFRSQKNIHKTYFEERNPESLKYMQSFRRKNQATLNQYFGLVTEEELPEWITWANTD